MSSEVVIGGALTIDVAEVSSDGVGNDNKEILEISEAIRQVMECPVCLLLSPNLTCICPNGHHTCNNCIDQLLLSDNPSPSCPLCRSLLINTVEVSPTELKLAEWMSMVRVVCAHRQFGCNLLITVLEITDHEAQCAYKPDVLCLVSTCQWIGVYNQLYDHVTRQHPNVASERPNDRLIIDDVNQITTNRRRTYLVKSPSGLFWVVLSKLKNKRIRISVFMVENRQSGTKPSPDPPAMAYRITREVTNGQSRTLARMQFVIWSSALLRNSVDGVQAFDANSIDLVLQQAKQVQVEWFRWMRRRAAVVGSATTTRYLHQSM